MKQIKLVSGRTLDFLFLSKQKERKLFLKKRRKIRTFLNSFFDFKHIKITLVHKIYFSSIVGQYFLIFSKKSKVRPDTIACDDGPRRHPLV
ncbi:TPA: hypothetical protein DEP34_03130 [Candidatus Uhrbacteria bacterium]|nr:hypothetical protein [Candidatus Uhrbacteria bacterium]HCB19356.1 hypothetical protein [Candidatus Uhrbacteria bacterium]